MKKKSILRKTGLIQSTLLLSALLLLGGCAGSSSVLWEDTKTVSRHIKRKGQRLWNREEDSRMIESASDFYGPDAEEFIPLKEEDLNNWKGEACIPQPKEMLGSDGTPMHGLMPSIEQFRSPSDDLAQLFRNVHFNTDEHVPADKEDYQLLLRIAEHLKEHKEIYLSLSGHCDERASEAYNLALGTRRANSVRSLLVKGGVGPDRIYTISFGKELPLDPGHNQKAWAKNRRVEFKIFTKDGAS